MLAIAIFLLSKCFFFAFAEFLTPTVHFGVESIATWVMSPKFLYAIFFDTFLEKSEFDRKEL